MNDTKVAISDDIVKKEPAENGLEIFIARWKENFIQTIKGAIKSRKHVFTLDDAIEKSQGHRTDLDDAFIEYLMYVNSNPLRDVDYFKYLNAYQQGKRLNEKYFRHDIVLLHELYRKIDENPDYSPFSVTAWQKYVLYMVLKFRGVYTPDMDPVFGVKKIGNREYNPSTNLTRPLRGVLPPSLNLCEFDIFRANPTFIDMELGITRTEDIYSKIDKIEFNRLLNIHSGIKGATIEALRAELKPIYNGTVERVITEDRFNNQGQMFRDLAVYEERYIHRFIKTNGVQHYVRLHDAVFVLANESIAETEFGPVKFRRKDVKPPEVVNNIKIFYAIDERGAVVTSPVSYADFYDQENLIRITEQGKDAVTIFKDSNNVVKPFNHKTDTASFLAENIVEVDDTAVKNKIALDNHGDSYRGYLLLKPKPLVYYSDTADTFGLPFKNGFCLHKNGLESIEILPYKDMDGFFSPHFTQGHEFEFKSYDGRCVFDRFLTMVSTGKDPVGSEPTTTDERARFQFFRMFGYLCHTYKDPSFSPAIILSDEGADDHSRKGGRGKSIFLRALSYVQNTLIKGGTEFDGGYRHRFADLQKQHKIYAIDDVPAGFKYDDLYTNIVGDITCERKGSMAETIAFSQAPKFIITTNWSVRYDAESTSTHRRFMEFKFLPFFNLECSPKDVFGLRMFDEWDAEEWNRFYNFVFECVSLFRAHGLEAPEYDKNEDNFKAYFYNDAVLLEFERVFYKVQGMVGGFSVGDFLRCYLDLENPLRFEKYFHTKNTKSLVDAYIKFNQLGFDYSQRDKKWKKREGF